MNAIDLIKQDHQRVEELFKRFEQSQSAEDKRDVVDEIVKELSVHAAIEEEIFYPSVREALAEGDNLVQESLHEHQEAKELLDDIDDMEATDPGFDEAVGKLMREVRHHVEEEETQILPGLQQRLDPELLNDMGKELENAKGHAPTRPHPMAPNTPPANKLAAPAAALIDRIRDRAQGRA